MPLILRRGEPTKTEPRQSNFSEKTTTDVFGSQSVEGKSLAPLQSPISHGDSVPLTATKPEAVGVNEADVRATLVVGMKPIGVGELSTLSVK